MLKKLLKYDLFASARIFCILYSIVAVLSIAVKIIITVTPDGEIALPILSILIPTYILLMIGLIVAGEIFLIVRFYKAYFTDEGYLFHTLPVKPWQLIASKLITSVILNFVGLIIVVLCILLLLSGNLLQEIVPFLPFIWEAVEEVMGMPLVPALILIVFLLIISECYSFLLYFASIALGQVLIPKHKIIGAFAAYMIFYMALQLILSIPTFIYTFSQMEHLLLAAEATDGLEFTYNLYHFTYYISLAISSICSVVFFFLTNLIMKKKLNLD